MPGIYDSIKNKFIKAEKSLEYHPLIPPKKTCLEIFVLTLVLFFVLRPIGDFLCFSIFTERDINRTYDLINGHLLWHGPELSWGGFTPGSFFYYYLSPSVHFWGTKGYINQLLFSFCLSAALLWGLVKHLTDYFFAFLILAISILTQAGTAGIRPAWNPCFLGIFWVILSLLIYHFRSSKQNSMATIGCYFFIVGLATQIHAMSISWVLIFFLFVDRISFKKAFFGILVTLLTFLPYFFWHFQNLEEFPLTDPLYNPLTSITQNFSFVLESIPDYKNIALVSIKNFPILITTNLLILFFWTLGLSIFSFFTKADRRYLKEKLLLLAILTLSVLLSNKSIINVSLTHYLIPTTYIMLAFIITVYVSLAGGFQRFSIRWISSGLLIRTFYEALTSSQYNSHFLMSDILSQKYYVLVILIFLIVAVLKWKANLNFILTCIFSVLFLFPSIQLFKIKSTAIPSLTTNLTSTQICKDIFYRTNWTYDEYQKNTMLLGTWTAASLSAICQDTYLKKELTFEIKKHNGVIVIKSNFLENILQDTVEKPNWLVWIESGKLEVTEISYIEQYTLIYYESRFENAFNIQNVGENYPTNSNYLDSKKNSQKYEIILDKFGQIYLIYDTKSGSIGLHGSGTSRFFMWQKLVKYNFS